MELGQPQHDRPAACVSSILQPPSSHSAFISVRKNLARDPKYYFQCFYYYYLRYYDVAFALFFLKMILYFS
jgi:hypothetical protein